MITVVISQSFRSQCSTMLILAYARRYCYELDTGAMVLVNQLSKNTSEIQTIQPSKLSPSSSAARDTIFVTKSLFM